MKKIAVLFLSMMLLVACASKPPGPGILGQYYKDLEPGPKGGVKERWIRPGADFKHYKKFMVDYVVFAFANDSESKLIDANEMKKLGDECTLAFINALKDKYPIVSEPGPDVLRIRSAIVDLKQSHPVLSAVTSVVPVGIGINLVKKGTTGAWTGSGATTCQFMAIDSMSNEVLAVAEDEYEATFTERFTKWGSAEDAFEYWGKRLRMILDEGFIPKS